MADTIRVVDDNVEATEAWNGPLFDVWIEYRDVVAEGVRNHGEAALAANPPHAVRMARRLLREAWNNRLDTVLEMSAAMQAVAHTTADHKEAMAALREKRRPRFTGA